MIHHGFLSHKWERDLTPLRTGMKKDMLLKDPSI